MTKGRFGELSVLVADAGPYGPLVSSMLRGLGIRDIREASSARQTLDELAQRHFGVLMIDDDLPDLDGVALVRQLRLRDGDVNRDMPVVMMATAPGVPRIEAARDAGVTEFLRKPFAANHVDSRLTSILTQPRAFIIAPSYAGPDRRRRRAGYGGEDRRTGSE